MKTMDGFVAISNPHRRAILDHLRVRGIDVSELMKLLGLSQPLVSKHLRALRDAGLVRSEVDGKRRVYRLAQEPMADVLTWIAPYARMWSNSFDQLERALDEDMEDER